jgi:hypothetical protein
MLHTTVQQLIELLKSSMMQISQSIRTPLVRRVCIGSKGVNLEANICFPGFPRERTFARGADGLRTWPRLDQCVQNRGRPQDRDLNSPTEDLNHAE